MSNLTRLNEFRASHACKRKISGGTKWEYISCGQGDETLLLLPEVKLLRLFMAAYRSRRQPSHSSFHDRGTIMKSCLKY